MNTIKTANRLRSNLTCFALALAALTAGAGSAAAAKAPTWTFDDVERVVAVGDIHGAFAEVEAALRGAGVIDDEARWVGGKTHLVSVGDLLDRGAESRAVMDLLMRLQGEAAAAGGRVHVVPGNHEIMNVTGDLRYVAPGEYAAFAAEERVADRDAAFSRWQQRAVETQAAPAARAEFDAAFPPGYFAHRAAFSEDGRYGRWIASLPFFVRVNDTVFLHGGLSARMATADGDTLNEAMRAELRDYRAVTKNMQAKGLLPKFADYGARFVHAEQAIAASPEEVNGAVLPPEHLRAYEAYVAMENALIFAADGPLWYRGNAWCHPFWEAVRLTPALDNLGAKRVAFGHTPTPTRRITTRMDGSVIMLDTGMLPYYAGRPAALEMTAEGMRVYYADEDRWLPPLQEARSLGARPPGISDDQIEELLASAEIVASEELGMGVTRPVRVTLRQGDVTVRAVFKGEDTDTRGGSGTRRDYRLNLADSYKHDVVAYRLDKFLGIDLIPVTVPREFNGREGSLQFWVENSISELERREQNFPIYSACDIQEQYDLMRLFDVLIYNEDRNQSNLLFDKQSGQLRLIDHSRAFRTHRGRPEFYKNVPLRMPSELADRLRALDREVMHELAGELLDRKQIRAVLKRRDEILAEAEIVSGGRDAKGVAD